CRGWFVLLVETCRFAETSAVVVYGLCSHMGSQAPKARNAIAWAIGPGGYQQSILAPKVRNDLEGNEIHYAFVAHSISHLQRFQNSLGSILGRCHRLLHFAPLALPPRVFKQFLPLSVLTLS